MGCQKKGKKPFLRFNDLKETSGVKVGGRDQRKGKKDFLYYANGDNEDSYLLEEEEEDFLPIRNDLKETSDVKVGGRDQRKGKKNFLSYANGDNEDSYLLEEEEEDFLPIRNDLKETSDIKMGRQTKGKKAFFSCDNDPAHFLEEEEEGNLSSCVKLSDWFSYRDKSFENLSRCPSVSLHPHFRDLEDENIKTFSASTSICSIQRSVNPSSLNSIPTLATPDLQKSLSLVNLVEVPVLRRRTPNWSNLPSELTFHIIKKMGVFELLYSAQLVCKLWNFYAKSSELFEVLDFTNSDPHYYYRDNQVNLRKIAHEAIRRSENLIELHLDDAITYDDLLLLNLDKFSHLRCLRITCCSRLSVFALIHLVNSCPMLENPTVCMCLLSPTLMEQFGRSCPHITSFAIACSRDRGLQVLKPGLAGLIIQNMPKLHSLFLRRIQVSCKQDFFTIVKGCPTLEYFMDGRREVYLEDKVALRRLERFWNGELMDDEEEAEVEEEEENEGQYWSQLTDQELGLFLPRNAESYRD